MFHRRCSIAIACVLGLSGAYAADRMDKSAVQAEHDRIEAAYKADKDACKSMKGNEKDVCQEEAKAKEKVAMAELKYKETGSPRDREKLAEIKAKADYDVAKERCEDKPFGAERSKCKSDAKAAEKTALENAKKGS
jgi:hypothetical protein